MTEDLRRIGMLVLEIDEIEETISHMRACPHAYRDLTAREYAKAISALERRLDAKWEEFHRSSHGVDITEAARALESAFDAAGALRLEIADAERDRGGNQNRERVPVLGEEEPGRKMVASSGERGDGAEQGGRGRVGDP